MINNTSPQQWKRMEAKRLDQVFISRTREGLGCSPFEAECLLTLVHEVYGDFFSVGSLQPGQQLFSCVSVETAPQVRLEEATLVTARLTVDGPEDLEVRREQGVVGLRRHRMQRMAGEALAQGGVLTLEDLALRLLNCGRRTLCSDLKDLRGEGIEVPLRSTVKDMGRTLSHRRSIVTQWLRGREYSEIARATHHSVRSVQGYVSCLKRIAVLQAENVENELLPFLAAVSPSLAREYLQILQEVEPVPHRKEELKGKKKPAAST